jgi:hypothetical protein
MTLSGHEVGPEPKHEITSDYYRDFFKKQLSRNKTTDGVSKFVHLLGLDFDSSPEINFIKTKWPVFCH